MPPRIFRLPHCHGYPRFTSPLRIRRLITPVFLLSFLWIPFFVSFWLALCFFFWHPVFDLFFVSLHFFVSLFLSLFLMCLSAFQEFFRNLSHWMDQHAAMNDAGNFLIETCDETVSLDLKQQLLLLNGRWRDLFLKVKQVTKNMIKNDCMPEDK